MSIVTLLLAAVVAGGLEEGFVNPPQSAKPHTWYHMMNGNVTKAGITRDFEELSREGFGGVQMFDAGCEIPPGGLDFNSPEWFEMFRHAASEARRLGLEICIPNCSGWSSSGGPWIQPSNGMKRVEFTELNVKGPKRFSGKLAHAKGFGDWYEDIAVLAFPRPKAELVSFDDVKSEIKDRGFTISASRTFTANGISYQLDYPHVWHGDAELKLEVSEDGVKFRPLQTLTVPLGRSGASERGMRFQAFDASVTAKAIRGEFSCTAVPKLTIKRVRPEAKMALSNLGAKTFAMRQEASVDRSVATPDQLVAKASVVNLTAKLKGDSLDWEVPEGEWTILRIGHVCNGRHNHPASDHGRGLEVDKLSASAMDFHFEQYVARLCRTLGPLAGKVESGFNNILVDSYEVGSQNWTQGLEREFQKRRGYDLIPYLPVFSGRIVGSVAETERFLEDFRRVVADLFAENYAGELTKKCHEYGLMCSIEPYGSCPADNLQYGQHCDIPMGEFWSHVGNPYSVSDGNSKFVSYVAHVWGKPICGTESFTANPGKNAGRWMTTPFDIKAQGDLAYSDGVNRFIYHRYTHQPWPNNDYLPGMTMGRWGMHLDRNQTWWPFAKPFFRYQARCQYLLQRGTFVADVLFFAGEQAPNQGGNTDGAGRATQTLPFGYDNDVCPTDAMHALKVVDGEVVVPGGVRYRVLALPEVEAMSVKMLKTLARLQREGAKIAWTKAPTRAPGLSAGAEGDAEVRKLAEDIFAAGVLKMSASDALKALQVAPQVAIAGKLPKDVRKLNWIHRREAGADWFFTAMANRTPAEVEVSFRMTGREPELWDAESGKVSPAAVWREQDGRTIVRIPYNVCGSKFVVFRKPASAAHYVTAEVQARAFETKAAVKDAPVFLKAMYGAGTKQKDIAARLNQIAAAGFIDEVINNQLAGGDPARNVPKQLVATYVYRGVTNNIELNENRLLTVPALLGRSQNPLPLEWVADERGVQHAWAWQPLTAKLTDAAGKVKTVAAEVPAPVTLEGAWQVEFPNGFLPNLLAKGEPEKLTFDELVSWTDRAEKGVQYFSGTAVYRKRIAKPAMPVGARLVLDLGKVNEVVEVTVNGKTFEPMWRPPFRLDITEAVKDETIELSIKVANLWVNRLIGDDREFAPDCEWVCRKTSRGVMEWGIKELPAWVKEGKRSPTGRHTFTTWRHWCKDDELLPSALLGPVKLMVVVKVES